MGDYNSTHTGQIIDATISAVIAGKAGIQGVKVNGTEITPDSSSNKVDISVPDVSQTTGTSTTDVMSQKATTDALDLKANSSSLATVATTGSYNDLSDKPSAPNVVQTTGTSTTEVMSQNAVTTQLNSKANSSSLAAVATSGSYNDLSDKPSTPNVVQTTGSSTTDVMSQKATTDALDLKVDKVQGKALSTNDFTNAYKTKLDGIANGATKNTVNLYNATILASSWSNSAPYTSTWSAQGFLSDDTVIFDVVLSSSSSTAISELESWSYISKFEISTDSITATCLESKPTVDLALNMLLLR